MDALKSSGDPEFWEERLSKFGHTGWSDATTYFYDQRLRLKAIERALSEYVKNANSYALDYGCGIGDFAQLLSNKFDHVLAYDVSDKIIEYARLKNRASNITWTSDSLLNDGDGYCHGDHYDFVLSITVLQHITNEEEFHKLIDYLSKTLSKNGSLLVLETLSEFSETSGYSKHRSLEQLTNDFMRHGLKLCANYGFYHPLISPTATYRAYRGDLRVRLLSRMNALGIWGAAALLKLIAERYALRDEDYCNHAKSPTRLMLFRFDKEAGQSAHAV